jgi:hypothetical protein
MLYPLSYGGSSARSARGGRPGRAGRGYRGAGRQPRSVPGGYRRTVVLAVVEILVLLALLAFLLSRLGVWTALPAAGRRAVAAPPRASWTPAHDEVDGVTRVLLRRSRPGPDGEPVVLEDRVFATFAADDPAWEARFTEAMAGARFRCRYLDAEESPG